MKAFSLTKRVRRPRPARRRPAPARRGAWASRSSARSGALARGRPSRRTAVAETRRARATRVAAAPAPWAVRPAAPRERATRGNRREAPSAVQRERRERHATEGRKAHAPPAPADRDDDPNYNAYVIQAAAFFLIAALGLVWTVCACYECKKFTDCCCPNPECGPCACVECLPGFRPDASGDAKKTDGAGAVEMTEEV